MMILQYLILNGGSRPSTNEGFDYNLDGLMDFTVGNSTNNKVTVFTGDGTFASPINFEGNGNGETATATSDVNGDGIMDLFLGAIHSDEVILWLGDGNAGFNFSDKVTVGNGPWMISSGDVNNDGVPDVVCANSSGSSFSVVLCNSADNLSLPTNYPVGAFPISVDLGDIDSDLDLDIITSNFTGANFTLYENDGTGVFINRSDLPANQAGSCAVFHDRDNDGDMDMTGIDELEDLLILFTNNLSTNINLVGIPHENFILFQNYPNPFNPATTIQFVLPRASFVKLEVFNALGENISILVSENLVAGTYKYDWNASDLSNGIYFYSLTAESFKQTRKLVLLK